MEFDFQGRMKQCKRKMKKMDMDYIFLTPDANMFYVSGYDGEIHERHFFLVISQEKHFFFIHELYAEQVREETWIDEIITWRDSEEPAEKLENYLDVTGSEEILFSEQMQARFTLDLMKIFPDAEYGLAGEVFEDLRVRKTEQEINRIKESSRVVDEVIEDLRADSDRIIGRTEEELAEIIEEKMFEKGGEETSFNTTSSSGANGAKPHYSHGEKIIEKGEPVVLDFGCYMDHYPSDQTRTLVFGDKQPSDKFKEVHEIVRTAQQVAFEKVEPGVEAREVDEAARKVTEDAGYGEKFIHRTGHGVGLEVHEPPYINQENTRELEEGMVFSIEPGIYIEGEFGVRIEDLVVVTEDGAERLNNSERSWK